MVTADFYSRGTVKKRESNSHVTKSSKIGNALMLGAVAVAVTSIIVGESASIWTSPLTQYSWKRSRTYITNGFSGSSVGI